MTILSDRLKMDRLCENCKFWVATESMEKWGNCNWTARGEEVNKVKNGVLRRCDENCWNFEPVYQTARTER